MSTENLGTPEHGKGHFSYRVIVAQARKKAIVTLEEGLAELEKKGQITVLARDCQTRSKLLRQYDYFQCLVAAADENFALSEELVQELDYYSVGSKTQISIGLITFKETDIWLKWNVKENTAQFQIRGGVLDITEEKYTQPNGAIVRSCKYQLKGDMRLAFQYRDRLIEHKLADPKAITYGFLVPQVK